MFLLGLPNFELPSTFLQWTSAILGFCTAVGSYFVTTVSDLIITMPTFYVARHFKFFVVDACVTLPCSAHAVSSLPYPTTSLQAPTVDHHLADFFPRLLTSHSSSLCHGLLLTRLSTRNSRSSFGEFSSEPFNCRRTFSHALPTISRWAPHIYIPKG